MSNKNLIKILLLIVFLFPAFSDVKAKSPAVPRVYWDGGLLLKGQVGNVEIVKSINVWKMDSKNKLIFARVLKKGEKYRVYGYSPRYGGQFKLGGSYYVTNLAGYVKYKTPPISKLKIVNPEKYRTKLTLGLVMKQESKVIAPGVTQSQLSVNSSRGKQEIYILGVDQKVSEIAFETTMAKDQMIGYETVSSMADRKSAEQHYIIGGVNGDYFDKNTGSPTDLTVQNGELITTNDTPINERTIFGVTPEGKALIGNPDISIGITVNGENPFVIDSVNKRRKADQLVLYTPYYSTTTRTKDSGTEVVLTNVQGILNGNNTIKATVKEVNSEKGNTPIMAGEYILSGNGKGSEYLNSLVPGDEVEVNLEYDNPAWSQVDQAIGGRYHLVKNGQAQTFNIIGSHPRTAIGIKKDGSVFVIVIDGRQQESGGVTLSELAKVMKDLGAVESMTFDGGGSSTMVARQPGNTDATVINSPSDGAERRVANALLIVGRWTAGPLNSLHLSGDNLRLVAGATYNNLNIAVNGFDKNNNPITINNRLAWTSTAGIYNKDGSFTASLSPGKGMIYASAGNVKAGIPVEIVKQLDKIVLGSSTIIVEKNGTLPILAAGYFAGKKVSVNSSVFKYKVSGKLGLIEKGVFKAGNTEGQGIITVSQGKLSKKIVVIVKSPDSLPAE